MPPLLFLLAQMMTVTHVLVRAGKDKAAGGGGKLLSLRVIVHHRSCCCRSSLRCHEDSHGGGGCEQPRDRRSIAAGASIRTVHVQPLPFGRIPSLRIMYASLGWGYLQVPGHPLLLEEPEQGYRGHQLRGKSKTRCAHHELPEQVEHQLGARAYSTGQGWLCVMLVAVRALTRDCSARWPRRSCLSSRKRCNT